MTKYSDTEVLYVNLSDEAEALRLRTEANDARIETLQKRLSEAAIQGTVVTDEGEILTLGRSRADSYSEPFTGAYF